MSLPNYQRRGNNSPLTTDNYNSRTVGFNTNSALTNKNDSNFLATYPRQGYVRPPAPAPLPVLQTTRFYVTNFIVLAPGDIQTNVDFPGFSNGAIHNVFLDNYFMYPPSYYINKPDLTYHRTGSGQFDNLTNDKGFLFILNHNRTTSDRIPYYITNNFNNRHDADLNNKFIITRRKDSTSYYSPHSSGTTVTFQFSNVNDYATGITGLQAFPPALYNLDFTLFYNFRLYKTNLSVIRGSSLTVRNSALVVTDTVGHDPEVFEENLFDELQDVFFDNFTKINIAGTDRATFYTYPDDIITNNLSNLYIRDISDNAFYLSIGDLTINEVYVTKKPNPSASPEFGNNVLSSKIYYKIMNSTGNYLNNIVDQTITFNKVSPTFNENSIVSFRTPKNPAPAPRPSPAPAPVGPPPVGPPPIVVGGPPPVVVGGPPPATIVAGFYETNLRIVERSGAVANYTSAFVDIVPNNAVNGYYENHTTARADCTGLALNKCYTAIPIGLPQNKVGSRKIDPATTITTDYNYTAYPASNNINILANTASVLPVGKTVGVPGANSWAHVLSNGPNSGTDRTPQPVIDQRRHLSNILPSNLTKLTSGSTYNTLNFTNFSSDNKVYYSNISPTIGTNFRLSQTDIDSNLYVKHNDGWYFKILPQDPSLLWDPVFNFFWRITNAKLSPSRYIFVTLSNIDTSKNFVNSNATTNNIVTKSSYIGLTSFSLSTT